MFIDTPHHHKRLRLEIDAFVGAASSRDSSLKSAHESTEIAAGSRSYERIRFQVANDNDDGRYQ